jgi:poly-gamma-glutamate synthesis protein (capsule biosynthesis protein)
MAVPPHPITLALAGDVMLGRTVNGLVRQRGPAYPWGDLLPLLWDVDLFLVNLECALTSQTDKWGERTKAFHFRADPAAIEVLRFGRVDCAALANNHVMDFGAAGLLETVELLRRAGIAAPGAGPNQRAAGIPARLAVPGLRVHVLALADHPPEWAAGPRGPGINYTPVSLDPEDLNRVTQAVRAAREGADGVVVSMHWGPNMQDRPRQEFQAFARAVVDAGADVFWGHSAHVVQGVELRGRSLILYDTGDLIDDYTVDPELRNDRTALFLLRFVGGTLHRLDVVPVRISNCQANLATGEDREWRLRRLEELSGRFGTAFRHEGGRLVATLPGEMPALVAARK